MNWEWNWSDNERALTLLQIFTNDLERANKQTRPRRCGRERWNEIWLEFLLRQANLSITVWHSKMNKEKEIVCMCLPADASPYLEFSSRRLLLSLYLRWCTWWQIEELRNRQIVVSQIVHIGNAHGAPLSIWMPFLLHLLLGCRMFYMFMSFRRIGNAHDPFPFE